jgi:hypothetical protein
MPNRFGGVGVTLPLNQIGTNAIEIQAGEVFFIPPGYFNLKHGGFLSLQTYDPIMLCWRPVGADGTNWTQVDSDGNNYRVANQTGCPVAALLTSGGAGYTSAPTVTAGTGGSSWTAVMGQALSSVTVVTGGSNYTYPPAVLISAPGAPGIAASGYCTLSGSSISTVTLTDVGGGYTAPPTISFLNDPRDTTGSGGVATPVMAATQTVTGLICTNHGNPITGGTVPALTFAGGGATTTATATIIMCWTVTSYAVTNGGTNYGGAVEVTTLGTGIPTNATAYTNPNSQASFLRTRPAIIVGALSSTVVTATGQTLVDGGVLGNNPTVLVLGGSTGGSPTVATLTLGLAGANDFLWMQAG